MALDREKFRILLGTQPRAFPEIQFALFSPDQPHRAQRARFLRQRHDKRWSESWSESADSVINCLWDGRLALDQQLGHRTCTLICHAAQVSAAWRTPPCPTGPALVDHGARTLWRRCAVSRWFGLSVLVSDLFARVEPDAHAAHRVGRGMLGPSAHGHCRKRASRNARGIRTNHSRNDKSKIHTVDGGVIYSWGETDIDDRASMLHKRHEIGFAHHDGYYTVDTGKFTCAPCLRSKLPILTTVLPTSDFRATRLRSNFDG